MESFIFLKTKKIGVFGLGRTGIAAYKNLRNNVATIVVWDDCIDNRNNFSTRFGSAAIAELSDPRWQDLDKIILSPGIPLSHKVVAFAYNNKIEITSDVDILFEECKISKFIGITGTNGKSTTTALIYHIFKNTLGDYVMGGNIGVPVLDLPLDKTGYILELSSFQLDLVKKLELNIAILLNITPDHLDRHHTMQEYVKSKMKIFDNIENNYGIINVDNEITRNIFEKFKKNSKVIPISAMQVLSNGISIIEDIIYDNTTANALTFKLPKNQSLQGVHNRENIAAAIATCRILNIEYAKILDNIESFKGLPHRAQYLGVCKGISFYNDSKATNADATSKSLSFLNNIYWLLGGIAKEGGIDCLAPSFHLVKEAYIFGQDKITFAKSLDGKVKFKLFENLEEAFAQAYEDALADDALQKNILLSPAAASYDQFKNFEQRGDVFIELYKKLDKA